MEENNIKLCSFLEQWCDIKNSVFDGDAGLQFSINSTDDNQRKYLFSGNSMPLKSISYLSKYLPDPKGRKYALNFALADDTIIDANILRELFDPSKFMCKITPLHRTKACKQNNIITTGGYDAFTPYQKIENDMKSVGFDVIVFVPSYDEDESLITCGNAILSGNRPHKYTEL